MQLGNVGLTCMQCLEVVKNNQGSLLLCNFDAEYLKLFRKHLLVKNLGFSKIKDLLECFSCVLNIYGENQMKVVVEKEKLLNPPIRGILNFYKKRSFVFLLLFLYCLNNDCPL